MSRSLLRGQQHRLELRKAVLTSESKSGKIYANSDQRQTLMAIYLTDNYPDTSILEQVAFLKIRSKLETESLAKPAAKMML